MTNDELEFLISQHLDGTLDAAEHAKLQHALDTREDARALLASYEKLESALKASAAPVDIDADWLTAQIAARIDEEEAADEPVRTFKLWHYAAPLAAAAMLLIGLTIGVLVLRDDATSIGVPAPSVAVVPVVPMINLSSPPVVEMVYANEAVASVSVGMPANLTPATVSALYLSEPFTVGRVSIQPAGPIYDVFE